MVQPDLNRFVCYCVDLNPEEVRRLILAGRWREIEVLGVGHVCTGCRADYRLLKSKLKRDTKTTTSTT